MLWIIFGIFLILHGLVHLLYAGQSLRYFELQPGMIWPDNSRLLSKLINVKLLRRLCAFTSILSAAGFVGAGIAVLFDVGWFSKLAISTTVFSSVTFLFFWDGTTRKLHDQGMINMVINIVLAIILI